MNLCDDYYIFLKKMIKIIKKIKNCKSDIMY